MSMAECFSEMLLAKALQTEGIGRRNICMLKMSWTRRRQSSASRRGVCRCFFDLDKWWTWKALDYNVTHFFVPLFGSWVLRFGVLEHLTMWCHHPAYPIPRPLVSFSHILRSPKSPLTFSKRRNPYCTSKQREILRIYWEGKAVYSF